MNSSIETGSRLDREQAQLGNDAHAIHLVESTGENEAKIVRSSGEITPGTRLSGTPREWIPQRLGELRDRNNRAEGLINETYQVDGLYVMAFVSPVANTTDRYLVVEMNALAIGDEFQGSQRAEGGFTEVVSTDDNRVIITEPETASNPSPAISTR